MATFHPERVKIFGPKGTPKSRQPIVNVVMDRTAFKDMDDFANYFREMIGHFTPGQPHLFLFSEHPFSTKYFPKRREVADAVRKISEILAEAGHADSRVCFSVNECTWGPLKTIEGIRSVPAMPNTSFVIGSAESENRLKVTPKLNMTQVDKGEMMDFADHVYSVTHGVTAERSKEDLLENVESNQSVWAGRAEHFARKGFACFNLGGQQFEHRVCSDSSRRSRNQFDILAISGKGLLNTPEILNRLKSYPLALVTDPAQYSGNRVFFGRHIFPINHIEDGDHSSELKELNKLLSRKHIRLQVVQ